MDDEEEKVFGRLTLCLLEASKKGGDRIFPGPLLIPLIESCIV